MFKEDYYTQKNGFEISAGFFQERDYGRHEGIDYTNKLGKQTPIVNNINGIIYGIMKDKYYGKMICLKHNAKFRGGVDELIYSTYCHMNKIDEKVFNQHGEFIQNGQVMGFMGNTGKSMTFNKDTNKWDYVSINQQNDEKETAGVHLHISFYQFCKPNVLTKLLQEMLLKDIIKDLDENYFWQWNRVFINPLKVYEYFDYLQGKRK